MTPIQARSIHRTHCRYCASPLTQLERYSGDLCGKPMCRKRRLDDELTHFRDMSAADNGVDEPRRFPIVVVPHRDEAMGPVSAAARNAFGAYVRELVTSLEGQGAAECSSESQMCPQAYEATEDLAMTASSDHGLEATVCGACAGYCCRHGASRFAFVDGETVARIFNRGEELSAASLADAYLGHVPAMHYEGSCIFHARHGCSLPRDMRAAICNAYECAGLKTARERCGSGRPDAIFVVARQDNRILQGTFASADDCWVRVGPSAAAPVPTVCSNGPDVGRVE